MNAWLNGKHGHQAGPLPVASVYGHAFLLRESAHRLSKEPRTRGWGHRARPGAALHRVATPAASSGSNLSVLSGLPEHPLNAVDLTPCRRPPAEGHFKIKKIVGLAVGVGDPLFCIPSFCTVKV